MDKFQAQTGNGKNTSSQRGGGGATSSSHDADLKSRLKESANSLKQELEQQANIPRQAEQMADRARQTLAHRAERIATALDDVGSRLERDHEAWLGQGVQGLATRIRRASQHVEERRLEELAGEVRGWSASPLAFLGGAFVVGLAAGRFLKGATASSNGQRQDHSPGSGLRSGATATGEATNGKPPSQRGSPGE